jgi:hypothetical protein
MNFADRPVGDVVMEVLDNTCVVDTNVAVITSDLIEPALLRYVDNVPGADHFNATEISDYADYAAYCIKLLVEMRNIKYMIDVSKSITRADTAGSPWPRSKYSGMVDSLTKTEPVHIPFMSMNLAGLLTTPQVMALPIPDKGYTHCYIYPSVPNVQESDIESLLQTIATKFPGLSASNKLNKLGRLCTVNDLQYRMPQPPNSQFFEVLKFYAPVASSTETKGEAFDSSFQLNGDALKGPLGKYYDYMRVLGVGTASGGEFIAPTAAGAATEISIKYAAVDATSLTATKKWGTDADDYYIHAGWSDQAALLTGSTAVKHAQDPFQIYKDLGEGETLHNRILINALVRDMTTEVFPDAGLITLANVPLGSRLSAAKDIGYAKGKQNSVRSTSQESQSTWQDELARNFRMRGSK